MSYIDRICAVATQSPFKTICNEVLSSCSPFSRFNPIGHITASGLVIKDGKALLIFHPFIRQWFKPGGHIDEGETPIKAAIREVFEETGVTCESIFGNLEPVDIDLHEIPTNSKKGEEKHLHIDLLFFLKVSDEGDSPEGIEKVWMPFEKITNIRLRHAIKNLQRG